ncbi:unnamed protein product, partial [Timema podura]|nr:unnamed protein product [Timema podura]
SPSSVDWLNTTGALANYATEAYSSKWDGPTSILRTIRGDPPVVGFSNEHKGIRQSSLYVFVACLQACITEVKEWFGNQINLCRDRGLNPGTPAQKSDTLPPRPPEDACGVLVPPVAQRMLAACSYSPVAQRMLAACSFHQWFKGCLRRVRFTSGSEDACSVFVPPVAQRMLGACSFHQWFRGCLRRARFTSGSEDAWGVLVSPVAQRKLAACSFHVQTDEHYTPFRSIEGKNGRAKVKIIVEKEMIWSRLEMQRRGKVHL